MKYLFALFIATTPIFIQVPFVNNNVNEISVYANIMNYSSNPVFGFDRSTNAHETTHMIQAELRSPIKRVSGFYIPGGFAVIIEEPNIQKKDIIPYIPSFCKSYRYNTYITGQQIWENMPLKVFGEWNCYINDGAVSVEDIKTDRHNRQWNDGVSGCLDFSIYSIALAMAVKDKDPKYWKKNKQFRRFLIWNLRRAERIFEEGRNMKEFRWDKQEEILNNLRYSDEAKTMRKFIRQHLYNIWLTN